MPSPRSVLFTASLAAVPLFSFAQDPGESSGPASPSAPGALQASPAAEVAAPAATGSAPRSAAESVFTGLGTTKLESDTILRIIDKAFDTDSDAFNPEDGTLTWKGHTYQLGQMRAFRARFERYLAQPETVDDQVYRGLLDEVFKLLSTRGGAVGEETTRQAWQLLYQAAEYEADAGASLTVANQVFNAWRIRDEREAFAVAKSQMDRLRRQQQRDTAYATDSVASTAARAGTNTASDGAAPSSPQAVDPGSQLLRSRELAETEAKIQAAAAGAALSGVEAKIQFQTSLINLFLQRRFQHCLIGASFYRFIFRGTAQQLDVGKKELQAFLPSSDMPLTVETLEFLSREALNEVNGAMQAVRANYEDGQLVGALERLQETFFLGEYLPAVTGFERAKKQTLLHLYQQIDTARRLADLKDFDAVDKLAAEIGLGAKDFRVGEVVSALRSAQRMSTLALHAAQQAAAVGDFLRAQQGVERAASLWPLNPAIQSYTENMAKQVDLGSQAALLFDDAFKRGDLRHLYEQRSELAIALLSDAVRGPRLKEIIERMSRVEIFLAQARELLAQNNAFAAWEALEAAGELVPDDVPVNQRRAELAPRVANFVGRIDEARRHEEADRPAAALTQWLAAQSLYPASSLARLGIERVGRQLLDDLALETAPEK